MMSGGERGGLIKGIAAERISILYDLAVAQTGKDMELVNDYVKTLRKISAHYKIGMPPLMKMKICKSCNIIMAPGLTATVRLASSKGYIVYRCKICDGETHTFYRTTSAQRTPHR